MAFSRKANCIKLKNVEILRLHVLVSFSFAIMSIERNTFGIEIITSTNIFPLLLFEEMQVEQRFSPFIVRSKFAAQITKVAIQSCLLSLSRYRSL